MTLLATRQAFATALSTVPGVTGFVDPPGIMAAGGAWPLLTSLVTGEYLPAGTFAGNWRVLVVAGSTPEDALTFLDNVQVLLVAAIAPVAYITAITPVTIQVPSSAPLYGVELTTVRE